MTNDNRKNPGSQDQRDKKVPGPESYPGNPNREDHDSPSQQQGGEGPKRDRSHLNEDRSVTDRTVRRSVIEKDDEDDGEIDRLKG